MGEPMFRNPFVIEHRRVGVQAKDYVLAIALSEAEKNVITLLGVEPRIFVIERQFLLAGIVASAFQYFERQTGKREVKLALIAFLENLDLHFANGKPLDVSEQVAIHTKVRRTYSMRPDPAELFGVFLGALTAGKYGHADLMLFPGFAPLAEHYLQDAIRFTQKLVAKLN
ncbi:hypothetical protein ADM96_08240 [Burkholderia sp. ST111]|nr:hypothetical protein ADM96_08240 [Burkholderia sp. ST111]